MRSPKQPATQSAGVTSMGPTTNRTLPNNNRENTPEDLQPSDFLHRLKVDTAKLSAKGTVVHDCLARDLLAQRDELAELKQKGDVVTLDVAGEEHQLKLFPHGSNQHEVLMRNAELEVKCIPYTAAMNLPALVVRFGAQWWMLRTLEETRQFMRDLADALGVRVTYDGFIITEVHVCADHRHALTYEDLNCARGYATRGNAGRELHYHGSDISGLSKSGGGLRYTLYNKSLEVKKERKSHWHAHMRRYGLNPYDDEIWRVEVKAKREWLCNRKRHFSLDTMGNLNWQNLRRLWGYFTRHYLWFSEDPLSEKSATRTEPREWWERLAQLAQEESGYQPPKPPPKRQGERVDADFAQGVGCVSSSMAKSGADRVGNWVASVIKRVQSELADGVEDRFEKILGEELRAVVAEVADALGPNQQRFYAKKLAERVTAALAGKPSSSRCTHRPFAYG